MTAAALQALAAAWTPAELDAAMSGCADEEEAAALLRAWFATHREDLVLSCFPHETRYGNRAGARRVLQRRFREVAPARPGRAEHRVCEEMYRGCAKTASTRLDALTRLLYGLEYGVLFVNHTAPMATPHSQALQELVPKRSARVPMGSEFLMALYPGLCWSGAMERWTLHVPHLAGVNDAPHDCPVFAGGIGGNLRGFLAGFTRPTMAVFDDIETADSARSPTEREAVWRAVTEEAAGIAPKDVGLYSIMLCNALALDDAGAMAERDPGWIHDRVSIWSAPPPETGLVRELEALWHSIDGTIEQRNAAARAHPRAAEVEPLTTMDDPDMTVLSALCLRWSEGRKPFARNRECLRTSHGERTFDGDKIALCTLAPQVERADGAKVPLMSLSIAVWLDPRFSKNDKKNDFAAVVAVGRAPDGVLYTLDADLVRDRGSASRARVWSMLDRLLALGADPRKVRIGYETNGGAEGTYEETFDEDITARRRAGLFCPAIEGRNSSGSKLDRIETMEDALHGERWQIARHLVRSELWQQLLAVPHGSHDDGPDAMERAAAMVAAPVSMSARMRALRGAS